MWIGSVCLMNQWSVKAEKNNLASVYNQQKLIHIPNVKAGRIQTRYWTLKEN